MIVEELSENELITFEVNYKSPPIKFTHEDLVITSSMTSEKATIQCRTPLNNVFGFQVTEADKEHATFTWTNEAECKYQLKINKGFESSHIEPIIQDVPAGINTFTITGLEPASVYGISIKKICGEYESLYTDQKKIETTNFNKEEIETINGLFNRIVSFDRLFFGPSVLVFYFYNFRKL